MSDLFLSNLILSLRQAQGKPNAYNKLCVLVGAEKKSCFGALRARGGTCENISGKADCKGKLI